MAKRVNSISFQKAAIEIHEDGVITISEVKKDGVETHNLTEWLEEFSTDDFSKLVTLTIKEDDIVEGTKE